MVWPTYLATRNEVLEQQPSISGDADPDYPMTNALDGLTWSRARDGTPSVVMNAILDFGAPVSADCAGIAAHNLQTEPSQAGRFEIQYSDNGSDWTQWAIANVATDDPILLAGLPAESRRYWRFRLREGTGNPGVSVFEVGVLWLGKATQMPVSPNPPLATPPNNLSNRLLTNFGGGGAILGTGVLREGGQSVYRFDDLTWAEWDGPVFQGHYQDLAAGKPFFISWDNANRPHQAAYAISPQTPQVSRQSHSRVNLNITAVNA